jgi:hypothetical protein
MKRLVQFSVDPEGTASVWVEVDEPEAEAGTIRVAREGEIVERAKESFQAALDQVKPAVDLLAQRLNDLNRPAEIGVEFGLKLSAKAGIVLASADSEVTFKVSLRWKNER